MLVTDCINLKKMANGYGGLGKPDLTKPICLKNCITSSTNTTPYSSGAVFVYKLKA